ncbi:MAG: serine/threonine protein kinase, partial [Blastochloris sp.]|nr:serine/threonine protein kinase [Blastochloris sp.]
MTQLDLSGKTLGRFDIRACVGQGGMATVYLAQQRDLERRLALKILHPDIAHEDTMLARFRQEARSIARLEHPHIIPIYDVGTLETPAGVHLHYIAMKYIEGTTLKALLHTEGRLSLARILALLHPIGSAVDYAHQQGILHRDIKPSNMLIDGEGHIYLSDFGLACGPGGTTGLTKTGMVMGTPEYMSPEQARGLEVDTRSDIFSLGVLVYEMVAGCAPFCGETVSDVIAAILRAEPKALSSLSKHPARTRVERGQ